MNCKGGSFQYYVWSGTLCKNNGFICSKDSILKKENSFCKLHNVESSTHLIHTDHVEDYPGHHAPVQGDLAAVACRQQCEAGRQAVPPGRHRLGGLKQVGENSQKTCGRFAAEHGRVTGQQAG